MSIDTAKMTNKQLSEIRNKLRLAVNSVVESNSGDPTWNRNTDYAYCNLMSQIEDVDTKLAARKRMENLESSSTGIGYDDPMVIPSKHPKKAKPVASDDGLTMFRQGESVVDAFGSSEFGLGETIRRKVLGLKEHAALGESTGEAGGYTVTTQTAASVIDLARAKSVLTRAGMQFGVMNSSELRMPKLTSDPTFQVKAENVEFNEASMEFGALVFYPVLIGSFITISRELVEDSTNFQGVVEDALASAFAVQLDGFPLAGATGDRVRVGLLDDTAIGETGSTGTLTWAKIAAEATTIRSANHEPNAVLLHPSKRDVVLDTLAVDSGVWLGPPPSLAGVQMFDSTTITSTKGLVGDFSKLILVVRGGPLIESTSVGGSSFKAHQVHVKVWFRGDFGETHPAAFRRLAGIT